MENTKHNINSEGFVYCYPVYRDSDAFTYCCVRDVHYIKTLAREFLYIFKVLHHLIQLLFCTSRMNLFYFACLYRYLNHLYQRE